MSLRVYEAHMCVKFRVNPLNLLVSGVIFVSISIDFYCK